MKKFLLFLGLVIVLLSAGKTSFADNNPKKKKWIANDSLYIFNRHKKIFYLGYGEGTIGDNYINPYGFMNNGTNQTGPVYFKFERAISPKIGIGLNTWYVYDSWSSSLTDSKPRIPVTYTRTYSRSTYAFLARFNYHASVNRKIDAYLGGGIGYQNASWQRTENIAYPYNDTPPTLSPLAFEATAGARYLIGPHWLIYVEAGYCKSIFQAGISFNIPKP